MVLLISYDLNGHERPSAYATIAKIIRDNAEDVRKPLYSQWFVKTSLTPSQWVELLKSAFDADDKAFILQVKHPYDGWQEKEFYAWLEANI